MIEKMILCILMKLYWFECVVVVYAVWKKIEGTIFFRAFTSDNPNVPE
jgi:hypothetical protein